MIYLAIIGIFGVLGGFVGNRLRTKFAQYSKVQLASGLSGAEIAQKMLAHYNIHDVQVLEASGFLTDHYNPMKKTVNLSGQVFHGRNAAAAAVAAHECGHAVQHATAYSMLQFRSKMVPIVKIASSAQQFIVMGLIGGFAYGANDVLLLAAIAVFGATTLFSVVTLPVEFDASKRALAWLDDTGFAKGEEYAASKDALKWAAMTYVVAALSALATLLYFILRYMNSRD